MVRNYPEPDAGGYNTPDCDTPDIGIGDMA